MLVCKSGVLWASWSTCKRAGSMKTCGRRPGSLLSTFHLSNPPARLFADRQARQRPNTLIVFADEAKAPEKSQLMLPGYSGGNSIALTLRGSTRRPGDRLLLPCSSISTHSVLSRTVWSEAKKPLSDLRGAAQRDLGHGSMPTGCILYAVNSFFAGVLGIAGCTVSSTL
jgi:hypothetical protein